MSTFRKPPNVRYVDMAIFIDETMSKDDISQEESDRCYQYIYHLYNMIAVKGCYFNNAADYDSYALYAATCLYLRYQRIKAEENSLPPIKSCLNYVKNTAYPFRVNYQKANFAERFNEFSVETYGMSAIQDKLANMARTCMQPNMRSDFVFYLNKITNTIKNFIDKLPYRRNKVMTHNIYVSCLLTLLKATTVSNENKLKLNKREDKHTNDANYTERIYKEEQQNSVTLFHLDPSMYNYIATIVNEIKRQIVHDLRYIIGLHEPTDAVIKNILTVPLEDGD